MAEQNDFEKSFEEATRGLSRGDREVVRCLFVGAIGRPSVFYSSKIFAAASAIAKDMGWWRTTPGAASQMKRRKAGKRGSDWGGRGI